MSVLDYRSTTSPQDRPGRARWLGWAVYLGMSWTWCIGMFLPVLLVRDYGIWGWVIFAVPNVIGAAAMGWMITEESARAIRSEHSEAVTCFSAVTIAFQLFFAFWMLARRSQPALFLDATLVLILLFFCVGHLGRTAWHLMAAAVFMTSLVCWWLMHRSGELFDVPLSAEELQHPSRDLVFLGPISAFGFLLCPYLDRTFLIARSRTSPTEARAAFGLGFGGFFAAMIVMTLMYAPLLAIVFETLPLRQDEKLRFQYWLSIHWVVQLAFTVSAHCHPQSQLLTRRIVWKLGGIFAIATFLGWSASAFARYATLRHDMDSGEFVYRLFMAFYGLVFPAYVWLCMIPGRGRTAPTRRQWLVLAIAVLIAAPMFWMGFIERKMGWLGPGLAVVLFARLLVPKLTDRATFQPEARQYGEGAAL